MTIRLMDGQEIEGRIRNFDRFALIVDQAGTDQMLFKHAIASIREARDRQGTHLSSQRLTRTAPPE